jgi:hypothetical protein
VVELFAVSSNGLRRMEAAAADSQSAALAQAAALEARLAAAERERGEQERASALEWRKLRHEAARLKVELRRAEEARREAKAAADAAGMRVLQLEQRVGELSSGAQVQGRGSRASGAAQPLPGAHTFTASPPAHAPTLPHPMGHLVSQELAAAEARVQGLSQRLSAMETAYEAARRSWAADAEGCA